MIQNPYWDEVKDAVTLSYEGRLVVDNTGVQREMQMMGDRVSATITPRKSPSISRFALLHKYSFSIPDPATIRFVAKMSRMKLLDMGAGNGYWAWILSQIGADVLAIDVAPPDRRKNRYFPKQKTWFPVRQGGSDVMFWPTDRTLFISWPPFRSHAPARWLKRYRGDRIIFIGEYNPCVCADSRFYQILEDEWELIDQRPIVAWDFIRDRVHVYQRPKRLHLGPPVH